MKNRTEELILGSTGATSLTELEKIQDLWSGYGSIKRYQLTGSSVERIIVKRVQPPTSTNHPRGWNSNLSHQRKLKSYAVEMAFYDHWREILSAEALTPLSYGLYSDNNSEFFLFILEDLNHSGFAKPYSSVNLKEIHICLDWLATFHVSFLGKSPDNLWKIGTYWHLSTRPDELAALEDQVLKNAAGIIDRKLNESTFQTILHGDAKLANFCFSNDGEKVAAVDFQYAGGGPGVKDVAYFLGSCLDEENCRVHAEELLEHYLRSVSNKITETNSEIDQEMLISEWRELFPFAWADFHRFIKGWSPGHWKVNSFSEKVTAKVLKDLGL